MKRKNSKIEDFFTTKRIKIQDNDGERNQGSFYGNIIDEARNVKHEEVQLKDLVVKLTRLTDEEIEEATKWKRNNAIDEFKCIPCSKTFSSRKSFYFHKHNWQCHNKNEKIPCKRCKRKFITEKNLENHICSFCLICAKFFSSKTSLRKHQRAYHSKEFDLEKFTCDLCAKEYGSYRAIKWHIEEVHSVLELKFKCGSHCERTFRTSRAYQIHLRGVKKEKCKICQKEVTKLSKHMFLVHGTNERPYECLVCSKRFKLKTNLKIHEGIHDKKFQCEICQRKFATTTKLKDHLKLHENPDLFQCQICKIKLSSKSALEHHLRTHVKNRKEKF
jgi:KRAB domain-containing zinc finger protein